jgi:uncharacterized protein (DUF2252 family)
VQLCGDAHLSNFGAFASPERRPVFDLNDFDETLPGRFEWDVKRLVASMAVAGRGNGLGTKKQRRVALAAAAAYVSGEGARRRLWQAVPRPKLVQFTLRRRWAPSACAPSA